MIVMDNDVDVSYNGSSENINDTVNITIFLPPVAIGPDSTVEANNGQTVFTGGI